MSTGAVSERPSETVRYHRITVRDGPESAVVRESPGNAVARTRRFDSQLGARVGVGPNTRPAVAQVIPRRAVPVIPSLLSLLHVTRRLLDEAGTAQALIKLFGLSGELENAASTWPWARERTSSRPSSTGPSFSPLGQQSWQDSGGQPGAIEPTATTAGRSGASAAASKHVLKKKTQNNKRN
jgi:hypothetical protein